jgi:hypothetical protein
MGSGRPLLARMGRLREPRRPSAGKTGARPQHSAALGRMFRLTEFWPSLAAWAKGAVRVMIKRIQLERSVGHRGGRTERPPRGGLSGRPLVLGLAIGRVAEPREAEQHHRPSRGFRDAGSGRGCRRRGSPEWSNASVGRRTPVRTYIPGVFTSNSMLKRLAFFSGLLSPQSPSIEPPPVAP